MEMPFFEDFMTLEFIQNMIGLQIITTSYILQMRIDNFQIVGDKRWKS